MSVPSRRKENYSWKYSTEWESPRRERRHIPENILPHEDPLEQKGDVAEIILKNEYPLEDKGDIWLKLSYQMSIPSKRKETYSWKYSTKWVSPRRERRLTAESILPNECPFEEKGDIWLKMFYQMSIPSKRKETYSWKYSTKWVSPRRERRHSWTCLNIWASWRWRRQLNVT